MTDYLRSFLAGLAVLGTIVVGMFFMLGGFALLVFEVTHPPTHTTHVVLFAAFAVLGALMLPAISGVVIRAAKSGLEVAGPYLPTFGRRANSGELPPPKDGG